MRFLLCWILTISCLLLTKISHFFVDLWQPCRIGRLIRWVGTSSYFLSGFLVIYSTPVLQVRLIHPSHLPQQPLRRLVFLINILINDLIYFVLFLNLLKVLSRDRLPYSLFHINCIKMFAIDLLKMMSGYKFPIAGDEGIGSLI